MWSCPIRVYNPIRGREEKNRESILHIYIHTHTHIYVWVYIYILFHYGLSQDIEYSSLCYTYN